MSFIIGGGLVTARITVDASTTDFTSVVVTLTDDAGLTIVSGTPTKGAFVDPTWTIGDMSAGDDESIDVVLQVDDLAALPLDLVAVITPEVGEQTIANNTVTHRISVGPEDLVDSNGFPIVTQVVLPLAPKAIDDTDSPYAVNKGFDQTLIVDGSAGDVTVTLGDAADWMYPDGRSYILVVKVLDDNAGAQTITLDGGADTIFDSDETGALTMTLVEGQSATVVSDGTNFHVITKKTGEVAASETGAGVVELATVAEVNTGTDATRPPSVDSLAGSDFGVKELVMNVYDIGVDVDTNAGLRGAVITDALAGMDLVNATVAVHTLGTSTGAETITVNVTRRRAGADVSMLSTPMSLEKTEYFIADGVIDAANDDVIVGDMLFPAVTNSLDLTDATGMTVTLEFRKP